MNSKNILMIINLVILKVNSEQDQPTPTGNLTDTLILSQIFFRHGDRSPLYQFPFNHVNITEKWPMGLGQLTGKGKQEMFQLGQFLRQRYATFLSDNYHPDEVYILSSDYDRTISSAQALLAGLYIPKDNWNPTLNWDTIPIRTIPHTIDLLLAFSQPCKNYKKELDCFRYHGMGRELDRNHSKFYAYLAHHSGVDLCKFNFETVSDIFDTLYVQDVHGFGLPTWCNPLPQSEPNLMRKISEHVFTALTYSKLAMELRGGPLIREIFKNIDSHKAKNPYKLRLYSGHDSTIATTLQVLGVYNRKLVPYAGAVIIELYKRSFIVPPREADSCRCCNFEDSYHKPQPKKNLYYIKVFYRNCTNANFVYELPIPDCQDVRESTNGDQYFLPGCKIKTLKKLKSSLLSSSWLYRCKMGSHKSCSACKKFKDMGHDYSNHDPHHHPRTSLFEDFFHYMSAWFGWCNTHENCA